MKKSIANKWVKALRSGEYTQTQTKLCDNEGHCCLGVLCELYIKDTKRNIKGKGRYSFATFDGETELLPSCVMKWAGMIYDYKQLGYSKKSNGTFLINDNKEICLASWNDGQSRPFRNKDNTIVKGTFENIANVIEKHYKNI